MNDSANQKAQVLPTSFDVQVHQFPGRSSKSVLEAGNQRVWLAVALACVVFPVLAFAFGMVLPPLIVILSTRFGGLGQGHNQMITVFSIILSVAFSSSLCWWIWRRDST